MSTGILQEGPTLSIFLRGLRNSLDMHMARPAGAEGGEVDAQDTMISEHELLENGNKQQRCQVVRWVRTFPFSFLSKREYCIGRRMWRSADGCLYGITKVTFLGLPLIALCQHYDGQELITESICLLVAPLHMIVQT